MFINCYLALQEDLEFFGMDWDGGPLPTECETICALEIPETLCPLCVSIFQELQRTVDPLGESTNYGIDIY